MKILKFLFIAAIGLMFFSCQKELGFNQGDESIGFLKADITHNCVPAMANGIYRADSSLTLSNFIEVQVDASTIGRYTIISDTTNGYSFIGEGTITATGLNTLRIYGHGRPFHEGIDTFTINYGTTFCQMYVTVIPAISSDAVFTLGGSPSSCSGFTLQGDYQAGIPLANTNTATMNVNVSVIGAYHVTVPSTNGMQFSADGVFTTLGAQSVTLIGSGTPVTAGTTNLTASAGTNSCTFSVTVNTPGTGSTAVFSLQSTSGICNGAIVSGSYTTGVALSAVNTVVLTVDVTTVGTYSIATNVVNGISFSKNGVFTSTGMQPIILIGSGSPVAAGTMNLTATSGATSSCSFSLNVVAGAANLDYIPQTVSSNWTYQLQGGTADDTTHYQVLPNAIAVNGNTYNIFQQTDLSTPVDSLFYRKLGGKYYKLFDQSLGFDIPLNKDVLVLDSSVVVNGNWVVNLGSNTIGGVAINASVKFVILEKGATATFGSVTYTNIIKVKATYYYNAGTGDIAYLEEESWYAKGKGLVYSAVNDVPVTASEIYEVLRAQVY